MTGDAVVGGLGAFDNDTIQPGYPRRPLEVEVDEGDAIQREIDRADAYEAMVRP